MPSPYATQRPTTTRASFSTDRTSLSREAGLPDTGRPDDRREPARRLSHRGRERMAELVELSVTTDEGRDDRARKGGHVRPHAEQPPSGKRLTLPLRLNGGRRLDDGHIPDEAIGRLPDAAPPPSCAACSSRAATLTASPVASF